MAYAWPDQRKRSEKKNMGREKKFIAGRTDRKAKFKIKTSKNTIIKRGPPLSTLHQPTVVYMLAFQIKALHGKWS